MKKIILILLVIFLLGCENTELLEEEIINITEETFCYECQETHTFDFYNPAFYELSYIYELDPYVICDVNDSYIFDLINSVYLDTVIYVTDIYSFDFNNGITGPERVVDGDTVGIGINFLHCEKLPD